jgi:hypothetical protein
MNPMQTLAIVFVVAIDSNVEVEATAMSHRAADVYPVLEAKTLHLCHVPLRMTYAELVIWLGCVVQPSSSFRPMEVSMFRDNPSDGSSLNRLRYMALVEWWTQLEMSGDCGATNWRVLDPIRDSVTACLGLSPPNLDLAEHLTAKALRLVTGEEKG